MGRVFDALLDADILISQWNRSIDDYMAKGFTEKEAFGVAFQEQAAAGQMCAALNRSSPFPNGEYGKGL